MLVGCDNPLMTVFTERFGSVMNGPLEGELTFVCKVTELSLVSESLSVALTLAVFVNVPGACGTTRILMTARASLAIEPSEHVTLVAIKQLPCVGVDETKLIPGGRLSVTTTFVAGEGPLFMTVMRYVRFANVTPGFGEAVFVIARFAFVGPETINCADVEC